jgi:hypothetical protein
MRMLVTWTRAVLHAALLAFQMVIADRVTTVLTHGLEPSTRLVVAARARSASKVSLVVGLTEPGHLRLGGDATASWDT